MGFRTSFLQEILNVEAGLRPRDPSGGLISYCSPLGKKSILVDLQAVNDWLTGPRTFWVPEGRLERISFVRIENFH